VGTRAGRPA
jgi:transposase